MIGELLCRIGKHDMRSVTWPLGMPKSPNCVGECKRCGEVRWVEATPYGGVEMGRWKSMDKFRESQGEESCELEHRDLHPHCKYCPDCGVKLHRHNAGGMARELAAQDSDNSYESNG